MFLIPTLIKLEEVQYIWDSSLFFGSKSKCASLINHFFIHRKNIKHFHYSILLLNIYNIIKAKKKIFIYY